MNLAYIDPNPLPEKRTVPLQILQNVDALGENGVDVWLFSPQGSAQVHEILNRPLNNRVHHQTIPNLKAKWWYFSGSNRYFYKASLKWLSTLKPEVVFVRNLKLAHHILAHTSFPVFFECHEIFQQSFAESHTMTWKNKRKLKRLADLEQYVYENARGLIVKTQTMANDLQNYYAFSTPILISPNGYDHHLAPSPREKHFAAEKTIILYLGSLHPWKGIDVLFQALPFIHPQGEVWIAGGTPQEVADYQTKIKHLNLSHRIKMLGAVPPKQRFDVINQADICVHPLSDVSMASRYTSPLKLFEYMAMGKPIVTADVPALREVLTHEHTALLTPPHDPGQLAEALNRLMKDHDLAQTLGQNALKSAVDYTWIARTRHILDFITNHST